MRKTTRSRCRQQIKQQDAVLIGLTKPPYGLMQATVTHCKFRAAVLAAQVYFLYVGSMKYKSPLVVFISTNKEIYKSPGAGRL